MISRVQRTFSLGSLPMSVCIAAIMVVGAGAVARQPRQKIDLTELSGDWRGEHVTVQTGFCSIDGGTRSTRRARLLFTVAADGSVAANEYQFDAIVKDPKLEWTGTLQENLKLTLEAPGAATCSGNARQYTIKFEGTFTKRRDSWQVEMKGRDTPCPNQPCAFLRSYSLAKTASADVR